MAGFREVLLSRRAFQAEIVMMMLATSILLVPLQYPAVSGQGTTAPAYAPNRSKSATDLPAAPSASDKVDVTLVTKEVIGQLADGVTYTYWTYNGTVPGPFIRLRVGQVVTMHMKNPANSTMTHSIDSHGIMGPGGGSALSQTAPGNESIFQFTAMYPGLFVYHCGTPDIPTHIANGMYGMMLIEPKEGLPKVDEEFYVEQGEVYTIGGYGQQGHQDFSFQKAQAETPDYVVFNGRVGALTGNRTMRAKVGDTVRVFFGNIGPNLVSSMHIIGGILNRVYLEGSLVSPPVMDLQTTLVPAGGTVMVEFTAQTPGVLTMVDHSLFRLHKGAAATFTVAGPSTPAIITSLKNGTGLAPGVTPIPREIQTVATTGTPTSSNSTVVMIQNFVYSPAQITITAGTTVTWVNKDTIGHTVTEGIPDSTKPASQRFFDSSHGGEGASAVTIQPGQSWSFTFTTPGQYDYYCLPHSYMRGHVTVTPGGSQSYGYGSLTNFYIILTGKELIGLGAFALIVFVGMVLVFTKSNRKPEQKTN